MSGNEYIELENDSVEVQEISVRISVSAILQECTEEQLIDALIDQGFTGWVGSALEFARAGDDDDRKELAIAAALEDAPTDALWEALGDKEEQSLIDLLDNVNALEAATRRWLDNLAPNDLQAFLVQHAYIPRPASELTFVADTPTSPVHWVNVAGIDCRVGMILPDLSNLFEGRAKLRMFIGDADDSGWIDCSNLPKAQRMARMLYAGRGAMIDLVDTAQPTDPHGAGPCTHCVEQHRVDGDTAMGAQS
jgi:hypothetical protein